jgi:DNA-directed RNA polymerase subunit RPC12/RpoP
MDHIQKTDLVCYDCGLRTVIINDGTDLQCTTCGFSELYIPIVDGPIKERGNEPSGSD